MAISSTSFKPGQVTNPGGRKKADPAFKKLLDAKQEWALKELINLAKESEEDSVRLKAIQYIIDRGQGKPAQAINLGDAEGNKFNISVNITRTKEVSE